MKLILDEPGSTRARGLWYEAESCFSTVALYAEARAAIAAARRARRLHELAHRSSLQSLHHIWVRVRPIDLTERLALRAGELAEAHALRGYDAIHLASAEAVLDEGDVMVVSDERLAGAAASIGIEALIPGVR